jgi:transposase InsO family protein
MSSFRIKIQWSARYILKILTELFKDLWAYYASAYPLMLILGSYRRIARRLKIIWLPKPKGRPPIHENVVDLIIDMKRSNTQWGAQRISDELNLMGIQVSKKTVLKILRENGFEPPKLRFAPPTWRSVLDSFSRHWAMDFTTVFDRNGLQIFIFSILEVPSRQLILINATANPTREWLAQQFRNCSILGYHFPSAMVHDRDGIYGNWLPDILKRHDCLSVKTPPRSPWCNPHVERFNRTIKDEVLNRVDISNVEHVRQLCSDFKSYYNGERPHQGINGVIPSVSKIQSDSEPDLDNLRVEKINLLNGLVTQFKLVA